jgi:hypothetical protein
MVCPGIALNLEVDTAAFQEPLYRAFGTHLDTVRRIMTDASDLWKVVTGISVTADAEKWDSIDDMLGDPDFPESDFVSGTLKKIREQGIDAADNKPQMYARENPEAGTTPNAIQQYVGKTCDYLLKLGMKMIDGVVVQGVGKEAVQISVPVLKAPGLAQFQGNAEPMIGAFVALVWAVYEVTAPTEVRLDL